MGDRDQILTLEVESGCLYMHFFVQCHGRRPGKRDILKPDKGSIYDRVVAQVRIIEILGVGLAAIVLGILLNRDIVACFLPSVKNSRRLIGDHSGCRIRICLVTITRLFYELKKEVEPPAFIGKTILKTSVKSFSDLFIRKQIIRIGYPSVMIDILETKQAGLGIYAG